MKNLIFINGTMGVGKTTTSKELQQLLPECAFLDGDWCWDSNPFIVTEETKAMVLNNIIYLLNSFLKCSEYKNIVFCWVMHEESIIQQILDKLEHSDCKICLYSLVCTEEALKKRLNKEISGIRKTESMLESRTEAILERSIARLKNYESMNTVKVDVSIQTAREAAEGIYREIYGHIGTKAIKSVDIF